MHVFLHCWQEIYSSSVCILQFQNKLIPVEQAMPCTGLFKMKPFLKAVFQARRWHEYHTNLTRAPSTFAARIDGSGVHQELSVLTAVPRLNWTFQIPFSMLPFLSCQGVNNCLISGTGEKAVFAPCQLRIVLCFFFLFKTPLGSYSSFPWPLNVLWVRLMLL